MLVLDWGEFEIEILEFEFEILEHHIKLSFAHCPWIFLKICIIIAERCCTSFDEQMLDCKKYSVGTNKVSSMRMIPVTIRTRKYLA